MAPTSWSPVDEYKQRQNVHQKRVEELETRHIALGYIRLLFIIAIMTTAWLSLGKRQSSPWLIGIPALMFIASAVYHARLLRSQANARRAVSVYSEGLARVEDRWSRTTERALPEHLVASSLYARDLDIAGRGSLFELLCVARTRMGEHCLLDWLLNPPSVEIILQRQTSILELRGQLDFRERMAVSGEAVSVGVRPESLKTWAQSSSGFAGDRVRWLATGLRLLALGAALVWIADGMIAPLLGVLLLEWCVVRALKTQMAAVLSGTDEAFQNLRLVSALLIEIEQQSLESPYLQELRQRLLAEEGAASDAIASLGTLVSYKDALNNPLVRLFNLPLMYSVHLAFAIQGWRQQHGGTLGAWLDAVGEMEALLSLATYSYEHPEDPFPTFVDGPGRFDAQEIGHPLLPSEKCVRNSLSIGGQAKVLLISGSNMSGKSTLMRTVGINTVLAMCGAPVRAKQLHLTPLRIGASLLVNDSLQRGASRFYAEIEKLQAVCSLAQQPGAPVLFLLDELLQGTNSTDRMIGAQGITRELVRSGAIGILTTHDLSLTAIDDGDGSLKNLHFQDSIVNGKMQFDFLLRDGVVTKSNGVELMRLIGLKV